MINAMPILPTIVCLIVALLGLMTASMLIALTVRHRPPQNFPMYLVRELVGFCFFFLWSLFMLLAVADLTFVRGTTLVLRWAMLLYPAACLFLALTEHEVSMLVPGLFAALTVPFFETAFGKIFPYELMAMLLLLLAESLLRLVRGLRQLRWKMDLRSILEAVDGLEDGLLFADETGEILLTNRIMDALSTSLCHQPLTNAVEFWKTLEAAETTEFITKISAGDSFLFRFAGGNIWTLHREMIETSGQPVIQIVALNVTESDQVQRQLLVRKTELAQVSEQLAQVKATISQLQQESSRVERGTQGFETITDKMTALNRFFSEHYALPAETFDYKRLAVLTAGLLQELEHAQDLTPEQQLEQVIGAFALLNIAVTVEGELPNHPETTAAFLHVIREAAINAVVHGGAGAITVTLEQTEQEYRCKVSNNGAPLVDALNPGGGITGIRRMLFPLNGQLEITREPEFSLLAKIPVK